jgi:hypothetical protein
MPDAVAVEAADAVALALATEPASSFAKKFSPEVSFADWELPLEDAAPYDGRLLVDVIPVAPVPTELDDRGGLGWKPSVDIIVRRRMTPEQREADGRFSTDEIRELCYFVQQLTAFFCKERLASTDAVWESTQLMRLYVAQHLREHHQFTAQIRLTFSTTTDIA